ncbi:MAG: glycine C-acetyltransferase [Anaerolineae bacterium]|nr:glycine C-acetyltransferase [Anaerolineae bacterium]
MENIMATEFLDGQLAELKEKGLYNTIRVLESAVDAQVTIGGRQYLNFTSNNYLGLANHPRLKAAAKHAIDLYGIGPAAVRTIAGTTSLHEDLEHKLAQFKRAEATLTLQGGFLANLATIPALVGDGDLIFSDELNHASIIDGCRLSKARVVRYAHNDPADLREKIRTNEYQRGLIITDGVFSMDGDIARLPELVEVAREFDLMLMVDDAHGEGVLGEGGRGIVDHFGLHGQVDIEIGTMSKAFGVVGGVVAGKQRLIDWLKQRARPLLFSSAMTIPDVAACSEAINVLEESDDLVKRLWANADYLKQNLRAAGFDIGATQTPIVPVIVGEAATAQAFSRALFDEGIFVMPIFYPTVPQGKARLRIMNSAVHQQAQLDRALDCLSAIGKKLGVIR